MSINPLANMHDSIIDIIEKSVVKYKYKELEYETIEMTRAADRYISASLLRDNYYSYLHYDEDVLLEIIPELKYNPDMLILYKENRRNIPEEYHDLLLQRQRKKVIDEYEEKNEYYRELIGLPPLDATEDDYVYVDGDTCLKYGIDPATPIHKMTDTQCLILETNGVIDQLIEAFPEKEYLKHLGVRRIDIIKARQAKDYALLYVPVVSSETLRSRFINVYSQCREYVVTCIFVPEMRSVIDYYDNFLAMIVMLHTIGQTFAQTIKTALRREYYDPYCTKILYSVYGVPYNEALADEYQKAITQYLNILVLNKGTNKCLFDVSSLLGYERAKLYKYYLMRDRVIGKNGLPITKYKEDGSLDYEAMYDVYFSKVPFDEKDFRMAILKQENRVEYDTITSGDPFWYEDKATFEQVYESEYNYYESKYIGMSMEFRLTEIIYETIYLINMIFDKKEEMDANILVSIPKLTNDNSQFTLFDATVILCALLCKYHGLSGNILYDPSKILHIVGFNFDMNWNVLEKMILDNEYLSQAVDNDGNNILINAFLPIDCVSVENINKVYDNRINLIDYLTNKMARTDDIFEYRAYRDLYRTMYIKDENIKSFTIGDYVPRTYLDYIMVINYSVYNTIMKASKVDLYRYIENCISQLLAVFNNADYIHISIENSTPIQDTLLALIKFFKSYTTDFVKFGIVYVLNWKPELLLRLIDRIDRIYKTIEGPDKLYFSYDDVAKINTTMVAPDNGKYNDKLKFMMKESKVSDSMKFHDTISMHYVD